MPTREVEHEITIGVPAAVVYELIADVTRWPQIFPPTVHVQKMDSGDNTERLRIWATANGTAKTWLSRRELDPARLRVTFRQEVSQPPVGDMGGVWLVDPLSADSCRVRLLHDYHAIDDDPADLEWIDQAVDRNSRSELAALKENAELDSTDSELLLSFEDTVLIDGAAEDVYDFINDAQRWQERLPHVARVSVREEMPGLQVLEMDTLTKDGSTHTTKSVRVCLPPGMIVYKQVTVPALMTMHTGHWQIDQAPAGGLSVTSRHVVRLNEENIASVLGPTAGLPDARDYVHTALRTNSLATLGHTRSYAEQRRS
jgi:aromatase